MIKSHFDREIQEQIRNILNSAKYSIRVAMYNFTDDSLFRTICHKAEQGVEVEILLDSKAEHNKYILDDLSPRLAKSGGSIFLYDNSSGNFSIMHNKFCLVDDRFFLTGSYNWTYNAAKYSNENIVIVDDALATFEYTKKFNQLKLHAKLHTDNIELPIYLSASKNVVRKNELVEISWRVPNADKVTLNNKIVDNISTETVLIDKNMKFNIFAENKISTSTKAISVSIAEKPQIIAFKLSEKVVRRGQYVEISWEVNGASKIIIEPFGEVQAVGTREHLPQTDTIYKLITFDVWGEESIKELSIRVPDFNVPSFENISIPVPHIKSIINLEIKKPVFSQSITNLTLKEMATKQALLLEEQNRQLNQLKGNRTTFYKELKKSIREKSTQIRFNHIKSLVIDYIDNILNQLLIKLRKSR